jgi:hypothetical protein
MVAIFIDARLEDRFEDWAKARPGLAATARAHANKLRDRRRLVG